jgi:glycogen operon protein
VDLLIFDDHDDLEPIQVIALDADVHREFFVWSVFVHELKPGMHYAFRVHGPRPPPKGTVSTRARC